MLVIQRAPTFAPLLKPSQSTSSQNLQIVSTTMVSTDTTIARMVLAMMKRIIEDSDAEEFVGGTEATNASNENNSDSISMGGSSSSGSSTKSPRTKFDYDSCRSFVLEKVLGENATADFPTVYRISLQRFHAIHDDIDFVS
jgi:hypothetical protein